MRNSPIRASLGGAQYPGKRVNDQTAARVAGRLQPDSVFLQEKGCALTLTLSQRERGYVVLGYSNTSRTGRVNPGSTGAPSRVSSSVRVTVGPS